MEGTNAMPSQFSNYWGTVSQPCQNPEEPVITEDAEETRRLQFFWFAIGVVTAGVIGPFALLFLLFVEELSISRTLRWFFVFGAVLGWAPFGGYIYVLQMIWRVFKEENMDLF